MIHDGAVSAIPHSVHRPFLSHFPVVHRSFSVVFGRFWSFSHKNRHYRHAFGRFQPTQEADQYALSDVQKPLQPRLHVLARLFPLLPLPTVGRHMAVVAEASQIMSIESQRAHLLPAPARTDRPHVVHLLGRLVHDAAGHTFLAERMGADIRRPKRVPPLGVNNALILLSSLAAPPVSTTASTARLLCISFPVHIDRARRRE